MLLKSVNIEPKWKDFSCHSCVHVDAETAQNLAELVSKVLWCPVPSVTLSVWSTHRLLSAWPILDSRRIIWLLQTQFWWQWGEAKKRQRSCQAKPQSPDFRSHCVQTWKISFIKSMLSNVSIWAATKGDFPSIPQKIEGRNMPEFILLHAALLLRDILGLVFTTQRLKAYLNVLQPCVIQVSVFIPWSYTPLPLIIARAEG